MAAKETAEEKIARIFGELMDKRAREEEEKKNPAYGQLRKMMREEFSGALADLLGDKGDATPRRRSSKPAADDEEGEDEGGLLQVLGLK